MVKLETEYIERIKNRVVSERAKLDAELSRLEKPDVPKIGKEKFESRSAYGQNLLEYLQNPDSTNIFSAPYEWTPDDYELQRGDFWLFRVDALTFEEKAPRREAMENILGTFRGMYGVSFVYLILGDGEGIKFYFGVAKDVSRPGEPILSPSDFGKDILGPAIRGNFRGCSIEEVKTPEDRQAIIEKLRDAGHVAGILEGVPGTDDENENFQGVDRLVDVMSGEEFGFLVIARPYTDAEIAALEGNLFHLADSLSHLAHRSWQVSASFAKNQSKNQSDTETFGLQESESAGHSNNETNSRDMRNDKSDQQQSSMTESFMTQYSTNKSATKSQGNPPSESSSNSGGESGTENKQWNETRGKTSSESTSVSRSSGESKSMNESRTGSDSASVGKSFGESAVENTVSTMQTELFAKGAADWLRYVDEVLTKRIDYGKGKGLFLSCGYLFARHNATLRRLANNAGSLYGGPKGNKSPLRFRSLPADSAPMRALSNMQIPTTAQPPGKNPAWSSGLSRLENKDTSFAGSWFSVHELGVLTALPQKEIPGVALREEVAFGMNIPRIDEDKRIPLGKLVRDGVVRNLPACLDADAFDKHIFVTGVTGSGKTTTCRNLLLNWDKPFLVIEPAKTEYRALKEVCPDLVFFTPGKQDVAPFFLNPFELFPGPANSPHSCEAITSRADMIKATLEAAFDMEAAIPQILETAVYRAYKDKGWDVRANEWLDEDGNPRDPFADGVYAFPTMSDFWQAVKKVTEEEGFGERLRDEYMGSLKARIESLLIGSKGMMLDNARSVDFKELVKKKVVIELEEIKSGSEKSLLMGFILTNLLQAVQACHREDPEFRHITLVEEAHRLLSRYVPGDSMNKKQGVEVFADMLAEVRKYGESLIIVDQIPDKMTPEVIKNTNTKIVHKLFARDDKDTIGDAIALSDEQKDFLSKLETGRAVVFSQGWNKAVQVQMNGDNLSGREIGNEDILAAALRYYSEPNVIKRGVLRGIEKIQNPTEQTAKEYLWLMRGGHNALDLCKKIFAAGNVTEKDFKKLKNALTRINQHASPETWLTYLYRNCYDDENATREEKFFELMKKVVEDPNADELVVQKKMDYLKFKIEEPEERS